MMQSNRLRKRSLAGMLIGLARKVIVKDDRDFAEGDLMELYLDIESEHGPVEAKRALMREILRSMPGFFKTAVSWRMSMLSNYVKTALRHMMRQRGYSIINVSGLAIGMACFLMIMMWVGYVKGIDSFYPQAERIQQVLMQGIMKNNPSTPGALAPLLAESYPEIEYATRFGGVREMLVSAQGDGNYEGSIKAVDEDFFRVFPFAFVAGDPSGALKDPGGIVLTERAAAKYFPGENPMGRSLLMDGRLDFKVTGIVRNVPRNSTLRFDMLIPYERKIAIDSESGRDNGWRSFNTASYIRLAEGVDAAELNPKIAGFVPTVYPEYDDMGISTIPFTSRVFFFTSMKQYLYIFSVIGLFVLAIACLNFTNLSTARAAGRAREIGVRKVAGAGKGNVMAQFIGESVIFSSMAMILAIVFVALALPSFSANVVPGLSLGSLASPGWIAFIAGMVLVTGFLAGAYPAFVLSSFRPARVLKSGVAGGKNRGRLRSAMVVFQFILACVMIIGSNVIFRQLNFIRNGDTGYDRSDILSVRLRGETKNKYDVLKRELISDRRIEGVTGSTVAMPFPSWSTGVVEWEGKDPQQEYLIYLNKVDYDFLDVYGIALVEGRGFSPEYPGDAKCNILINETLAALIRSNSPLAGGAVDSSTAVNATAGPSTTGRVSAAGRGGAGDAGGTGPSDKGIANEIPVIGRHVRLWESEGNVIGIVRDFHFDTMENKVEPMLLLLSPGEVEVMSIGIDHDDVQGATAFIRGTWQRNLPGYPFDYQFIDDVYESGYAGIVKIRNLAGIFTMLAILVACMGLVGLASFMAERRSKEIGIRKVLGAADSRMTAMMLKEFVVCVLIANAAALPIAWFMAKRWLSDFAYHIEPGPELALLPLALTIVLSVLTVSWQTMRVVRRNPVETLKYE